MIGKNNHYLRDSKDGTKVESYSIKKFKVGAASVVIGASIFLGAGAVAQASEEVSNNTTADNTTNAGAKENVPTAPVATTQPVAKETTKEDVAAGLAAKLGGEVKALDKTKLESYIAEIEGKLADGTYANKTEESVAVLKEELKAAKATLADATTQDEITKAYSKLVTTANTKLKNKPVEKKETPAVDTTNGKETVGKKAENTEKKSESNSIENTGSKDPRNGKALDKNNAFRAETSKTVNNITYTAEFSNDTTKEIYVYNEEEADVTFTINTTSGNIRKAIVRGKGEKVLGDNPDGEVQTNDYGWNYHQIVAETPGTVTVRMTGKPNDTFKGIRDYTKQEDQSAALGDRYLLIENTAGDQVHENGTGPSQPGYFRVIVKSQTYKYDIQLPESNADKIGISNVDNPTDADITKIKNEIKIKYSDKATTEDARLASHKGEVLADKSTVVQDVAVAGGTVTVIYKDGSVDTTPVSSVARTNETPTVSIPFSDRTPDKKDIYIYNGEEVDIDITFNDDSGKIQSAALKRGGNIALKDIGENKQDNEWGLVTTVIKNETTTPATIKITGTVKGLKDNQIPKTESQAFPIVSRFATATDLDGAYIENQATKFNAGTNVVSESYKTDPGAFTITLKAQTAKYDVAEPTAKISVANPNSITEAELENIKNNISLEYSKNNNDARLADKKGERVTDSTPLIKDVKQDTADANKLVVTYKDGSTDKIDKSKFIKGGPAPTVNTTIKASGSIPDSVPSSDSELTGTGTPGATVKVTVKNPETGAVISEKTAVVGEDGTWKLPLEEGLNSNTQLPGASEAARRFFAPKNPVEITQVVNGIESESRAVSVAVGESKILPSSAAKDGESVVAGAKEVTITVPHDAGRSYFFYTNKGATSTTEVALEQSQNGWSIIKNGDKATIKSVEKGVSVHTITLTMNENALFQEGENKLEIISHNGPSSPPSRLGRYKINVTNEQPTLASKNGQRETTVNVGDTVDPVSLVTAADHEDDKDATLGTKVRAEVISVNGDESVKTVDTTTAGRYEVKYKAVDSQGKESDVLTHTVIVQGPAPTVELPYSNQANKQIYVYTGENTDLTFKGADEKEIKDLYLRGPGDISGNNAAGYGLPTGKVENGEVTGEGSVSEDKTSATIKMTGKTNLAAGKEWTSFIVSKDNDGKLSNTDYRALDVDPNAKEKPGYARFVVKNQTSKYDIATPTEKVAVTDPANVTQDELDKIKEKLQIEYSKNNDDANLAEKKGKAVDAEDAKTKIKSVEKDNAGNLVVTYTDGSKDTRPLSDFVAKNPEVTPVKDPA
ncbi:signal peptide protein, YSIRK family, partial [Gemella haemolysans]